jgi:CRP/FNR family transcriptional regulator, cyclic AMP receptor protein
MYTKIPNHVPLAPRTGPYERRFLRLESNPPQELALLLARAQLLEPLSAEQARWLARRIPDVRFGAGQILYSPTAASRIIFVLLEGRVRLYKIFGGRELTLEIVAAGELFGDVAALAARQRGTYAESLEASRVALLSLELLRRVVRENPEVGLRLAEVLARRLYEYRERMADVALKKVSARLASLLERLLESEGVVTREGVGIQTRYTHEQLATMIGAKRVAVSRAMSGLRRGGAVEVKGRRVYLRDEAALRGAAEVGWGEP